MTPKVYLANEALLALAPAQAACTTIPSFLRAPRRFCPTIHSSLRSLGKQSGADPLVRGWPPGQPSEVRTSASSVCGLPLCGAANPGCSRRPLPHPPVAALMRDAESCCVMPTEVGHALACPSAKRACRLKAGPGWQVKACPTHPARRDAQTLWTLCL